MSMTREEIIKAYEDAVVESGLAAAAGNEEAAKSYELFKAGLYALRTPTREQVKKVWAGCEYCEKHKINLVRIEMNYNDSPGSPERLNPTRVPKFCPMCGRPLTNEAVEVVMDRIKKMEETGNGID